MKAYETVTQAVNDLHLRGYQHDFNVHDDCLICDEPLFSWAPEEFEVDEVYRFEGDSDPGDENVVYAISSIKGDIKGVLVSAFGPYAVEIPSKLIRKLHYHRNQ